MCDKKCDLQDIRFRIKEIVFNTAKFVLAAIMAISIAMLLDLEFTISAGIVAILTIQPTKKETLSTALGRFIAFIAALIIAAISFNILSYNMAAFFVYLVVYILICHIFRWYSAISMNTVLISHFLTFQNMGKDALFNETMIFVIGVGIGIIANLHLRKNVGYIEELKENTDNQIRRILARMSERIMDKDMSDYNGHCLIELKNSIRKAKNVSEENFNNQFRHNDIFDKEYIFMREKQCQVLFEMYKSVRKIETTPITAEMISDFLREAAEVYHKNNTGEELMKKFRILDDSMKSRPLPVQRKEFEDRAELYSLLRRIEEFIELKLEFSKNHLN